MTNGQVFGLVRIATGGECIVCRETWNWLVAKGVIEIVDGKPVAKPQRALEILQGGGDG